MWMERNGRMGLERGWWMGMGVLVMRHVHLSLCLVALLLLLLSCCCVVARMAVVIGRYGAMAAIVNRYCLSSSTGGEGRRRRWRHIATFTSSNSAIRAPCYCISTPLNRHPFRIIRNRHGQYPVRFRGNWATWRTHINGRFRGSRSFAWRVAIDAVISWQTSVQRQRRQLAIVLPMLSWRRF